MPCIFHCLYFYELWLVATTCIMENLFWCSFMEIELPNLSSSIYSVDLCARLRAFLNACPPPGPTPPAVQLVITTADFQRDLASWDVK